MASTCMPIMNKKPTASRPLNFEGTTKVMVVKRYIRALMPTRKVNLKMVSSWMVKNMFTSLLLPLVFTNDTL